MPAAAPPPPPRPRTAPCEPAASTSLLSGLRRLAPALTARATDGALSGQLLLLVAGLIVVVTTGAQRPAPAAWEAVAGVSSAVALVLLASALAPWRRLDPRLALVHPAVALGAVTVLTVRGHGLGSAYMGLWVLAFVQVGLFLPRGSGWWLLPVAGALFGPAAGGWTRGTGVRAVVSCSVALLVCQVLALLVARQEATVTALRDLTHHDPLTGLLNRRGLAARLGAARDAQDPQVVVMLDLDHFKRLNDTRGHAAGDAVLVRFARALREAAGDEDVAARYGGEEFCLVVRGDDARAARVLARLRRSWAQLLPPVTFSSGRAVVPTGATGLAALPAADGALYRAKESGRDRDRDGAGAAPREPSRAPSDAGPGERPARPARAPAVAR